MKNLLIILFALIQFGCNNAQSNESDSAILNENLEPVELTLYEVFTAKDVAFSNLQNSLPAIEGFNPMPKTGQGTHLENIFGITKIEPSKAKIIAGIKEYLGSNASIIPMWSKYKIASSNPSFHLYLLKETKNVLSMGASGIVSNTVQANQYTGSPQANPYTGSPELQLKLNDALAKDWNALTKKVAAAGNGYLAIVIEGQVYSCPLVREPITGNNLSIVFDKLEEAKTISARLKVLK